MQFGVKIDRIVGYGWLVLSPLGKRQSAAGSRRVEMKNGDLPAMAIFYEFIDGVLYSQSSPIGDGSGWVDEDDYLALRKHAEELRAELERTK